MWQLKETLFLEIKFKQIKLKISKITTFTYSFVMSIANLPTYATR